VAIGLDKLRWLKYVIVSTTFNDNYEGLSCTKHWKGLLKLNNTKAKELFCLLSHICIPTGRAEMVYV